MKKKQIDLYKSDCRLCSTDLADQAGHQRQVVVVDPNQRHRRPVHALAGTLQRLQRLVGEQLVHLGVRLSRTTKTCQRFRVPVGARNEIEDVAKGPLHEVLPHE